MHQYSTDDLIRSRLPVWLALLAVAINVATVALLTYLGISLPPWIEGPSVLAFYAVLFKIFDRWGWRRSWLRKGLGISTPVLAGDWRGTGQTSYDEERVSFSCQAEIKQTWTQIEMRFSTEASVSRSHVASISTSGVQPRLDYTYLNEPKAAATQTMHTHWGTATLELDANRLHGNYYTGRDRQTIGGLELIRS